MRHLVKLGIAFVVVTMLIPLSVAWGTPRTVPPGASGANQYTETLPGPGGDEPTSGHPGNQHGSEAKEPGQVLGKANAEKLEGLGPEGVAAATLATESAPNDQRHPSNRAGGDQSKGASGTSRPSTSGSSAIGQVVGQLSGSSDSGGMGLLLPLLITMTVVAAAGYLVGRHRFSAQPRD